MAEQIPHLNLTPKSNFSLFCAISLETTSELGYLLRWMQSESTMLSTYRVVVLLYFDLKKCIFQYQIDLNIFLSSFLIWNTYFVCLWKSNSLIKKKSVSLHRNSRFVSSVALIIIEKAAIRCSPSNEINDDALILCAV